jgi:hypothetical protein
MTTRWLPQLVLLNVLERAQSLRYADDHAGGIRTYMAEGATLIVAPGEEAFFKKVSAVRFSADPDTLTRKPREPKFEPLNRPANGDAPIANDTSVHFLNWIDSKKLPVEMTIPVHGPPTTIADFRKAVEEMKVRAN